MNTQKYGLFCSLENLVFPHCKTTTFFPTLNFIIHPQPPTFYSLSWSTTRGNLPASKLSFWWTHEKSRESRTRKETWVRGWRACSQVTRQWDTSSLLGQFSFVLLNPIVFIYLRNHLTSLVLSFPLASLFFYINFFWNRLSQLCVFIVKNVCWIAERRSLNKDTGVIVFPSLSLMCELNLERNQLCTANQRPTTSSRTQQSTANPCLDSIRC